MQASPIKNKFALINSTIVYGKTRLIMCLLFSHEGYRQPFGVSHLISENTFIIFKRHIRFELILTDIAQKICLITWHA